MTGRTTKLIRARCTRWHVQLERTDILRGQTDAPNRQVSRLRSAAV